MTWTAQLPAPDDVAEYYWTYIDQVPTGDVLTILEEQHQAFQTRCESITDEQSLHRYEPGKWSIREVVGHLVDTERIFAFRALAFARADPAAIPGMEQDDYVRAANFDKRSWASLLEEARLVRASNVAMWRSFGDEAAQRAGIASDCRFTAGALAFVVAGHERHHWNVLEQRYL